MQGYGKIQVYTGDGKGKTSAALGVAFRACARGAKREARCPRGIISWWLAVGYSSKAYAGEGGAWQVEEV